MKWDKDDLKKLLQRDISTIERLYNTYKEKVYNYLLIKTRWNLEISEEILGETFFCAIESMESLKKLNNILVWLIQIASKSFTDFLKVKCHKENHTNYIDVNNEIPDNIVDKIIDKEQMLMVNMALEKLKPKFKNILKLKYIDNKTQKEIAKILNKSESSIDSILFKARQTLKKELLYFKDFQMNNKNQFDDNRLDWLLQNQNEQTIIPLETDNLVLNKIRNKVNEYNTRKKTKNFFLNFNFINYKFVFLSAVIIFIITSTLLLFFNYHCGEKFYVSSLKGHTASKNYFFSYKIKINDKIGDRTKISSKVNSSLTLKNVNGTAVTLEELTKMEVLSFKKIKNDDLIKIRLNKGVLKCNVYLSSINSVFQIDTEVASLNVKGTKFEVTVFDNKDLFIKVDKGVVELSNFIKLGKKFKSSNNSEIDKKINEIRKSFILIDDGNTIKINYSDIQALNNEFKNIIKITKRATTNSFIRKEFIDELNVIQEKINNSLILKINNTDVKDNNNQYNNNFHVDKIISLNLDLKEYYTSITGDENNIYLSSDFNKAVYCVDYKNREFKWKFSNEKLDKITNPAIPYKNKIIINSPDNIFILNKNGNLEKIINIEQGPMFWSYPLILNKRLFFPTFKEILEFKDDNVIKLEGIDANGEIYITGNQNRIYCNLLNDRKIIVYDLDAKKILWQSDKFFDRAFMAPAVNGEKVYLADMQGNIYLFDTSQGESYFKAINTDCSIMSNLIYLNNSLFFISTNGNFNRINLDDLKNDIIVKIDSGTDINKYLTKKILKINDDLYYSSDNGKIFYYNSKENIYKFISIKDNSKNNPLIGTPLLINDSIIFLDDQGNLYKLNY